MTQARWGHPQRARPGFNAKEADLGDKGAKTGAEGRREKSCFSGIEFEFCKMKKIQRFVAQQYEYT